MNQYALKTEIPVDQVNGFVALHDMPLDLSRLTEIKRNVLVPFMQQPSLLTHYADHIIQQQNQLLLSKSVESSQALADLIRQIIEQLDQSKKYLNGKKFNAFQRWFGLDVEQQAGALHCLNTLAHLLDQATVLSTQVGNEIYHSQQMIGSLYQYRTEMAHFVVAAEQFLNECEHIPKRHTNHHHNLDGFKARLQQKINTLITSQSASDLTILQLNLTQNVAMTILDRFSEAKSVLIPAWQQHILSLQASDHPKELERLNAARERLIRTLDHAIRSSDLKQPLPPH